MWKMVIGFGMWRSVVFFKQQWVWEELDVSTYKAEVVDEDEEDVYSKFNYNSQGYFAPPASLPHRPASLPLMPCLSGSHPIALCFLPSVSHAACVPLPVSIPACLSPCAAQPFTLCLRPCLSSCASPPPTLCLSPCLSLCASHRASYSVPLTLCCCLGITEPTLLEGSHLNVSGKVGAKELRQQRALRARLTMRRSIANIVNKKQQQKFSKWRRQAAAFKRVRAAAQHIYGRDLCLAWNCLRMETWHSGSVNTISEHR